MLGGGRPLIHLHMSVQWYTWSFGVTCWEVFSGGKTPYPFTGGDMCWEVVSGGKTPYPFTCVKFSM
jgi:hypothetical protein